MKDLQRNRLKQAFKNYMPLPATLEPHLRKALGRVLSNPGSLIRPEIVLNIGLGYHLPDPAAMDLAIGPRILPHRVPPVRRSSLHG